MELIKDVSQGSFGNLEGMVWFGLFDKYIRFSVDDSADLDYVRMCGNYLNDLPEETIKSLWEASKRYCNGFLEAIGEPSKVFEKDSDIINLIYPSTLIVPDPGNGDEPVIWMELNCEWDPEHGMEWVVRGDQVLYVGGFNGTDPWASISKEDSWNYA